MKPGARLTFGALLTGALMAGLNAAQADVVRYPIPNSTCPISKAVQVPGNATTYYVSGQVPPVVSKEADPSSPQAYGDTKTQTGGVLNKIKTILEGFGLGMADVVKMQVFLVHDARVTGREKGGRRFTVKLLGENVPLNKVSPFDLRLDPI